MIDICYDYGMINDITFNPKKNKWFVTDTAKDFSNCELKLGDVVIERENIRVTYLWVKFMMKCKMLVVTVDERIGKFNSSAYSVLLNTNDLSEQVRSEIIVQKCSPILRYGRGHVWSDDVHRLHVAYCKFFRYIFKLSWKALITELLNVFGV